MPDGAGTGVRLGGRESRAPGDPLRGPTHLRDWWLTLLHSRSLLHGRQHQALQDPSPHQ